MIYGKAGVWADRFKGYDDRLLERICLLLPGCVAALGDNPKEDQITLNLVNLFRKDPKIRRMFHDWEFQFEVAECDANGVYSSKGKIDIALFFDQRKEKYLAYEAKRLNIKTSDGIKSLAGPYVTEGVARFVSQQYSQGLPVGCMLGYVLNADIDILLQKLTDALESNKENVALVRGPETTRAVCSSRRFETDHRRSGGGGIITLRHALVPCF